MSNPKFFFVKLSELAERMGRFDVPYWLPKFREQRLQLEKCGFELVPLSRFICSIESGAGVYDLSESAGWRYLNVNNITPMGIDDANCGFISSPPDGTATNTLRCGDVVTGRVGTIGVFCKYASDVPAYISDNVFRIRLKDCDADYILAILNSSIVQCQIEREAKGSLQRVVNKQTIRNLLIPIPPLDVQRRLVAELDAAYAAKREADEKATKLLASIDDMVLRELGIAKLPKPDTSLSSRIFTVPAREVLNDRFDAHYNQNFFRDLADLIREDKRCCRLGSVGTFVRGVTYKSEDEAECGHAILRANNVSLEKFELDLSDLVHVNSDLTFSPAQQIKDSDILICAASGSKEHAGKVAYVRNAPDDTYIGGFMMVLRTDAGVNPEYVTAYMQSSIFRGLIFRHLGGTNINNVSLELLNKLPLILPDVAMQDGIALKASSIRAEARKLKADATAALDAAKRKIEMRVMK